MSEHEKNTRVPWWDVEVYGDAPQEPAPLLRADEVHAERHRLADLLDKRAADAGAHCLNVIMAGEDAKIIGNFEGRACALALAASIVRTGHDFANLPSAGDTGTMPDLAARLLAASEAAGRAEQRALFAEADAATMRRERDALQDQVDRLTRASADMHASMQHMRDVTLANAGQTAAASKAIDAANRERAQAQALLARVHGLAGAISMATFAGVNESQITEVEETEILAALEAVAAAIGGAS